MFSRSRRFGALAILIAALAPVAANAAGENRVTFGSRWWTQTAPEASYREFIDLTRGGYLESFLVREWNADHALVLSGQNGLAGDQSTRLAASSGVRWQLELTDDQIPHRYSSTSRTPFVEVTRGVYRLPDSLQARIQAVPAQFTSIMGDAVRSAARVENGFQTEVSSARLRARPAPGVRFEVDAERRTRSGHKAYGATFGFTSPIELLEPIRQRTWNGSASATYERGRARLATTFGLSVFRNDVGEMVWDNPRRLTDRSASADDASSQGRLDLAPDNKVVSGKVALGYQLPRRSTFSATVGMSQGTQNDNFLPMTINSAVAQRALDSLPARSLDAKRVRLSQDYRLTCRGLPRTTGTLRYNFSKDDNQTPALTFIGAVRADGAFTRGAIENRPFGNTRSVVGADLDFQIADPLDVGVVVERHMRERTYREIEKDDENVVGVNARAELGDDVSLSGHFRHGVRKLERFLDEDYRNSAGVFIEQPDLRRFDVANRKQSQGGGDVSWTPARNFSVDAQYVYLLNDYADSRYGLDRDEQHLVVTEATLRPRPRLQLSGGYGFGQVETKQNSNETNASAPPTSDAATDWSAIVKDRNVYVFGDAECWLVERRVVLTAGYEFTRSLGSYAFVAASAAPLPAALYRRHDARLGARWRIQNSTELGGRWLYVQYDVEDPLNENIPYLQFTGVTPSGIFLGDSRQDYRAHRLEVLATRRF